MLGSLRQQILYPDDDKESHVSDEHLRKIFHAVDLDRVMQKYVTSLLEYTAY